MTDYPYAPDASVNPTATSTPLGPVDSVNYEQQADYEEPQVTGLELVSSGDLELSDRAALRRVGGLSTELTDVVLQVDTRVTNHGFFNGTANDIDDRIIGLPSEVR